MNTEIRKENEETTGNVLQEETAGAGKLPKNVRQIGIIDKKSRIYMEDYVVTYLKRFQKEQKKTFGAAALYGKVAYVDDVKCVFVAGAAYMEAPEGYEDGPTEDMLLFYKESANKYFPEYVSVGVAVFHSGNLRIPMKWHQKSNLCGLVGRGEVFLDINTEEEETEYTFVHDDGVEIKEGHYIYYERNEAMQSFLVDSHERNHKLQVEEERDGLVSESCRMVLGDKKENRRLNFASFCASASSIILLAGMCIVGVNMMAHYKDSQDVSGETRISTVSQEEAYELATSAVLLGTDSSSENAALTLEEFVWNNTDGASVMDKPGTEDIKSALDMANTEDNSAVDKAGTEENTSAMDAANTEDSAAIDKFGTDSTLDVVRAEDNSAADKAGTDENKSAMDIANAEETSATDDTATEESGAVTMTASNQTNIATDEPAKDTSGENISQTAAAEKYLEYTIKKGDTLYEICMNRYGSISYLKEICHQNDIEDQDSIYYGQVIKLPEN